MRDSALDLLDDEELCTVLLHDGTVRNAAWNPWNHGWYFTDGKGSGFVPHAEVQEWWPAYLTL